MKLCFTTLGCPDWTFEEVLQCAVKYQIPYLEIRGMNGDLNPESIQEFAPAQAYNTRRRLAELNISIACLSASLFFHERDMYEKMIIDGKKAIDICERMKIPYIRVFGDQIPEKEKSSEVIDRVVRGIGELCAYGKGKGVTVLLEIHGDFNRIESVSQVIFGLKEQDNFGILWDIQHSDKVYQEHWRDFYEVIKLYVRHVHIRDQKGRIGSEVKNISLIGEGDVPLKEVVLQLLDDQYEGCFSLEWEKQWAPDLPELPIALESMIKFFEFAE
jgi:sugar phosphate isomerase/epimerase